MSDKDQCTSKFYEWEMSVADDDYSSRSDYAQDAFQAAWSHLSAELAANREENAQFNKAFLEVCDERDHWHSWSLIRETNEIALRKELAASREREARLIAVLAMANDAMNHMGDVLNGHDMAEPEDVEKVTPAFDAVRAALSQSSAPASEPAAAKCSMCHGTGLWNQPYAVPAGVEPPSPKKTTCPSCKGNGRVAAAPKEPNHE